MQGVGAGVVAGVGPAVGDPGDTVGPEVLGAAEGLPGDTVGGSVAQALPPEIDPGRVLLPKVISPSQVLVDALVRVRSMVTVVEHKISAP